MRRVASTTIGSIGALRQWPIAAEIRLLKSLNVMPPSMPTRRKTDSRRFVDRARAGRVPRREVAAGHEKTDGKQAPDVHPLTALAPGKLLFIIYCF
ncbi:MAG: hypothetical protein E6R08_05585 [Nevskiaceae bacterium]|nr:MAG: hypothetical protein E6R08_05585 [Nevskiaceae bacterium]